MQKKLWMRRLAAWLSRGSATVAASPARRTTARRKPRALLALEMLEDRRLLSAGSLDTTFGAGTGFATTGFNLGGTNNDQAAGSAIQPDGKTITTGSADGTSNVVRMTSFSSQSIGAFPTGVAVGDFNGDFKNDVATANYGANTIGVLLGNGNGTLGAQSVIALPANTLPFAVKTGVFNEATGFVDIVSGNFNGQSVSYIAGNGNGTFKAPTQLAIGHKIVAVAVGDVNGDNHQDVIASSGDGTLTVLLGNGNGTFKGTGAGGAFAPFSALTAIFDVAITNLNNAPGSKPALVVAAFAAGKVGVLPGNGDGTFAAPIFTVTGGATNEFLTAGDFNNDGKGDVATTNRDSGSISVLLGNGNGTFSSVTTFASGTKPLEITTADINRDGNLDLVAANQGATSTTGSVAVFLGNGNGFLPPNQFASAATYASGIFPFAVAAGEFNLTEGAPDVLVTNFDGAATSAVTLATNDSAVGTSDFALVRYNTDGSLDTTFGQGGKVHIGFNLDNGGTNEERAFSVGLDATGKVIVAGYAQTGTQDFEIAVARLNANGTMDTTFGASHNGKVFFEAGPALGVGVPHVDIATSNTLAILPSGAILVAGQAQVSATSGDNRMVVARLTSSGFLDPTFGSGVGPAGTFVLPGFGLSGSSVENDGVDGIVVQSDGKIVLSGFAGGGDSHTNFIAAARVTAAGALDGSFNAAGSVRGLFAIGLNLNPGGENDDEGTSVTLQLDGKILVGGFAQTTNSTGPGVATGSFDFAAIRLKTDGTLDTTFNFTGNGSVAGTVAFGFNLNAGGQNDDRANAIAVQKNGTIVMGGYAQKTATNYNIAVARLTANGTLDSQFGIVGSAAPSTGLLPGQSSFNTNANGAGTNEDIGLSLVIDNRQTANLDGTGDGLSNIIVSGFATTANGNDFAIARLNALNVIPISGDWTGQGFDTPGLYDPRASIFYLRNANTSGGADFVAQIVTITVGPNTTNPAGFGWIPIVGDWTGQVNPSTGKPIDGVGLYDPAGSTFFLWNNAAINPPATLPAVPDITFTFGAGLTGLKPVAGRFLVQVPAVSSVGIWDPQSDKNNPGVNPPTSTFLLLQTPSAAAPIIHVDFGPANNGVNPSPRTVPIMGDWNNKGFDSVGVWEPTVATASASTFLLRNTNTSGPADTTLGFGAVNGSGVITNVVVGKWAANYTAGVGLGTIDPIHTPNMLWHMTNQPGGTGTVPADFSYGNPLGGSPELVGSLDGATDLQPLTADELAPIVANALTRFAGLGLSESQLDALSSTRFTITNLPDGEAGVINVDGTISLDATAGGIGWFVDPNPGLGNEFDDGNAVPGSDAGGKIDLLTVVLHEYGHVLGLVDLDSSTFGNDLMSATLDAGTRHVDVLDALYTQGLLSQGDAGQGLI